MDWYYALGNQQLGPVSDAQLQELEATGQINPDTLVWKPGLAMWTPLKTVRPQQPPDAHAPFGTNRFCSQCGQSYPSSDMVAIGAAVVCANCKDSYVQRLREGSPTAIHRVYAGFWIRFVAVIIDGIIGWILQAIVVFPLSFLFAAGDIAANVAGALFISLLSVTINCFYESYFVASRGGTPGKLILSLQVIRADGARPSLALAVGRYFAKLVSSLTFGIGFIIAAFDDEKRTLHDRICDTRVVRRI